MKLLHKTAAICLILSFFSLGIVTAQENDSTEQGIAIDSDSLTTFSDTDDTESFGTFADDSSASTENKLSINGTAEIEGRYMLDQTDIDEIEDLQDIPLSVTPSLKLKLDYSAASTEISASLKMDESTIEDYPEDAINELTARAFLGDFIVEAGKMKLVWGKGDKLHVIDNFNANDYTDFVIPDYIDRRIAEPMLHVVWNGPSSIRAEAVYTPTMTADRFDTTGYWTPSSYTSLATTVTSVEEAIVEKAASSGDTASYLTALEEANSMTSDDLLPDTETLKYGQAGFRVTGTLGPVDLGASYYYGHYKQPSVNLENYILSAYNHSGTSYALPELDYDQLQVFGLEAAGIAGPFNLRGEFAYNLTNDTTGDDPWVHNNSIAWVGGFDVDLPISNLNINIQETGKYILNNDKIGTGDGASYETYDVDYNSDGTYTSDELVASLSDSYNHEKIKTELNLIWGIEYNEYMVMPKLTINAGDGLDFILSGLWIKSDNANGVFSDYDDNSFVQMGAKYQF